MFLPSKCCTYLTNFYKKLSVFVFIQETNDLGILVGILNIAWTCILNEGSCIGLKGRFLKQFALCCCSAIPKIIKTGFAAINLIYFFTAGPDEVLYFSQWAYHHILLIWSCSLCNMLSTFLILCIFNQTALIVEKVAYYLLICIQLELLYVS